MNFKGKVFLTENNSKRPEGPDIVYIYRIVEPYMKQMNPSVKVGGAFLGREYIKDVDLSLSDDEISKEFLRE